MPEQSQAASIVYVVEDDGSIRDSLALMLGLAGYSTRLFADAESFLAAFDTSWTGCVLADLRLPGMSGVELQAAVQARGSDLPFIIVTAHGDVPAARAAFLANAVDFIEKPFDNAQLMQAIGVALQRRSAVDPARLARLTAREREVFDQVVRGLHGKEVAAALGISARTVEVHKSRIMDKLGVRNVAELVRFALSGRANASPADGARRK